MAKNAKSAKPPKGGDPDGAANTGRHVRRLTREWGIGLWLLFLYSSSIWLVLGTVSAYLWQDKIRRDGLVEKEAVSLTVAGVVVLARRYQELEEDEAKLRKRLVTINARLGGVQEKWAAKLRIYLKHRDLYRATARKVATILLVYNVKLEKVDLRKNYPEVLKASQKIEASGPDESTISGSKAEIEKRAKLWRISWTKDRTQLRSLIVQLKSHFLNYESALQDARSAGFERTELFKPRNEAQRGIAQLVCEQKRMLRLPCPDGNDAARKVRATVTKTLSPVGVGTKRVGGKAMAAAGNKGEKADKKSDGSIQPSNYSRRLQDYISEFLTFGLFGFGFLAIMPAQLLTLILTLSMGALGSVISLTRTYFDKETDEPFSFYLFRTFLGMVTALSIFILAKAGQLSISDRSMADGTSENLNPFLISFLAILSGLFTEYAYSRIRRSGWAIFRSGEKEIETKHRYGLRLKAEMTGKDAAELATFAGVKLDTVKGWIDEKQKVPPDAQKIIAAWLGKPARDLFTDLPPKASEA